MNIDQFKVSNPDATSATGGANVYITSSDTPKVPEVVVRPRTSLSALVERLSLQSHTFKAKHENELKNLAPLATNEGGGATITSLRMTAGLTQAELARRIGQRQPNLSLIESGGRSNIDRTTMKKLCEALGCDMNVLDVALDNTVRMNNDYHDRQEAKRKEQTKRVA